MRVLVACEFSGTVRDAFRARGHDAWSCDLLPSETDGQHLVDDAILVAKFAGPWDLMIAHPPCTYLCNSGARWLYGGRGLVPDEARMEQFRAAAHFFVQLQRAAIPRIALENPIPHRRAKQWVGNYSQIVQPWQFGQGEIKATCLWLKNLPKLKPTNVVDGREARIHKMPPGPNRWQERSRTYQGIAAAMADQWGSL